MKKNVLNVIAAMPMGNKNKKLRVISTSKKLSSKFKDKTKLKHMHNIIYHGKCHDKSCSSHYGEQTKYRVEKRVIQHNRRDINSHLLKHVNEMGHERVSKIVPCSFLFFLCFSCLHKPNLPSPPSYALIIMSIHDWSFSA